MNWLKAIRERMADPDKFWREYHIRRREDRLAYFRLKRDEALAAFHTADSAMAYYESKIEAAKLSEPQQAKAHE
jgi:hypothetical protein